MDSHYTRDRIAKKILSDLELSEIDLDFDLDVRILPRFFSNLCNIRAEKTCAIVFELSCGQIGRHTTHINTHTHTSLPKASNSRGYDDCMRI